MPLISNKRQQYGAALRRLVLAGVFLALNTSRAPAVGQPPSDGTPPPANADQTIAALSQYMSQVRQGEYSRIEPYPLTMRYRTALLPQWKIHAREPNDRVAVNAVRSMTFLLQHAPDPADRRKVVDCLTELTGESYETGIRVNVGNYLLTFAKADDFGGHARRILQELMSDILDGTYRHRPDWTGWKEETVLLVGLADMQSQLPGLQELIERWDERRRQAYQEDFDPAWEKKIADRYGAETLLVRRERLRKTTYWQDSALWAAWRARARMGVAEDIRRCLELAESHPDPYYKVRVLFQQLAYIRQPEVVCYLQRYLHNDECPPPWEGTTAYSCATSATAALSKMLAGAPVRFDGVPSSDDVAKLREWMAKQTEWKLIR